MVGKGAKQIPVIVKLLREEISKQRVKTIEFGRKDLCLRKALRHEHYHSIKYSKYYVLLLK